MNPNLFVNIPELQKAYVLEPYTFVFPDPATLDVWTTKHYDGIISYKLQPDSLHEYAWLLGLLDGYGSISFEDATTGNTLSIYLTLMLTVEDKATLDFVQQIRGSKYALTLRKAKPLLVGEEVVGTRKAQFCLRFTGKAWLWHMLRVFYVDLFGPLHAKSAVQYKTMYKHLLLNTCNKSSFNALEPDYNAHLAKANAWGMMPVDIEKLVKHAYFPYYVCGFVVAEGYFGMIRREKTTETYKFYVTRAGASGYLILNAIRLLLNLFKKVQLHMRATDDPLSKKSGFVPNAPIYRLQVSRKKDILSVYSFFTKHEAFLTGLRDEPFKKGKEGAQRYYNLDV